MKESGSASKNQPQTSEARGSIITYSPSKFLTSVGTGRTTYSTHTHTTTATSAATTATKTNNSPMGGSSAAYYVVKAGSLGSAASMSGCIKVSSPPKGPPMAKSPALVVTSPCTPTESVMFKLKASYHPLTSTACALRSPTESLTSLMYLLVGIKH